MKIRNIVHIFLVLATACGVLAAASPAYAAARGTHIQFDLPSDGSYTYQVGEDMFQNPCNIPITYTTEGILRVNQWLDADGRPTHEIDIYGTFKEWVSANGKVINVQMMGPAIYSITWMETAALEIEKSVGATRMFTIPGYGRVNGGAGQYTTMYLFNISDPNPENWFLIDSWTTKAVGNKDFSSWDVVCHYLGGALA